MTRLLKPNDNGLASLDEVRAWMEAHAQEENTDCSAQEESSVGSPDMDAIIGYTLSNATASKKKPIDDFLYEQFFPHIRTNIRSRNITHSKYGNNSMLHKYNIPLITDEMQK